MRIAVLIGALACAAVAGAAQSAAATAPQPAGPVIHIEDVARFYKVYRAAHGHPTADQLQRDYLDPGSDGLHRFAKLRNITGVTIAAHLAADPKIYVEARRCMAVLPRVRRRLEVAIGKLRTLYPQAVFAPVTIAVGRGKPVGVTDASGVMIGLEALCAVNYLSPNVEDRFVHVIAHEYAHVQQALQAPALYNDQNPTVLEASLIEGAAEFTAELISGSVAYTDLKAITKGHEKEIETAFAADEDQTDLSKWLYNGTLTKPGDLGYWVGYRIVKSYYQHAADKRRALRDILDMKNPRAFLAKSGWYPGIRLR
ncbi:MAG: lytic murein transglycosylase [Alphaproteobacteria bacterium]|nr:lytic murein transglycosylase [Alphaproteobacteria bacterium]MDE2265754.1 lytic murein transglycosylase [Alphaproteobacteria bacterium]MDE2500470.1 lytic murein transglycosylase [Alphaproteobacteria bacterium]